MFSVMLPHLLPALAIICLLVLIRQSQFRRCPKCEKRTYGRRDDRVSRAISLDESWSCRSCGHTAIKKRS